MLHSSGQNVGGVTMPPQGRSIGVTMPPSSIAKGSDSASAPVAQIGVTMPPKWHRHSKLERKGLGERVAREEEREVHPDDMTTLLKVTDPIERMKVAKRLRRRRKKMYRDRDFGGAAMGRARTMKNLSQGRHTTRTDLSANNTLTQIEAAKNRVLPGASIPALVKKKLDAERLKEEALHAMLEMDNSPALSSADQLKEGQIDPLTGKELDINDIQLAKMKEEQEKLKPLLKKEVMHRQTGGRSYTRFADKRDDPDRLTWDEFKKLHGKEMEYGQKKEMNEYRKQLDADRKRKLKDARKMANQEKRKRRKAKRKRKGNDGSSSDERMALSNFLNQDSDSD